MWLDRIRAVKRRGGRGMGRGVELQRYVGRWTGMRG